MDEATETVTAAMSAEPSPATSPATIELASDDIHSQTAASPADALRLAEIQRTRAFIGLTLLGIVSTLGLLPLFSGDATIELVMLVLLPIGFAGGAGYFLWIRDPARYSTRSFTVLSLTAVVNAQLVVVYFGVFSAAVMVMVIGIYFFSRTESRYAPMLVYGLAALLQALCAGLIIGGVVDDPGLLHHADLPTFELIGTQLLVQILYFTTYAIGRSTRASTQDAIEGLQRAMLTAARRGALLEEARAELDRALRIGEPGPFTGRVLRGYKLATVIGRGAMGDIYEAHHAESGDMAAVKLLPARVLGDARMVERFMREARAASALSSPHVVRILATAEPTDPLPFIVMERLVGHDLAHILRQRKRIELAEVVELVRQVATVIDQARERGIVHRDLKPQNIFLHGSGRSDVWKVLDFGVASLNEHSGTLTQGHVVGTPAYMAPEQARGESVDFRTDIHALAAVAYRALTGHPAFAGRDVPALLYDVVHRMPERPGAQVAVPDDVDRVMAIGLAKQRDQRFASGAEMAAAFANAARGQLDHGVRSQADRLLADMPWGTRH